MGKHLLVLLGLILVLVSCRDNRQEITYLNNEITTINDSIFYKGQVWGEEFKIAVEEGDYSRLPAARQEIESYIESSIQRVSNMEDVGGSEDLRKAELDYLSFERDVIVARMKTFEAFSANTPQNEVTTAYGGLVNSSKEEQQKLEALHAAQRQYADNNGLQLKQSNLSHIE